MNTELGINERSAAQMDAADPLARFRDGFHLPKGNDGKPLIYLTGNSLGLQPKSARGYIEQELNDWAELGVEGHLNAKTPWLPYHEFLAEQMAAVVGALPIETVVMNSLTVNLHLLMVSFYRPTASRFKIIIEKGAFPSDQYAVESQLKFHASGGSSSHNRLQNSLIELSPRAGETTLRTEDI
ncbi:MAG TPA: hypothetical protein VK468_05195, partial [Pyrinomonadaceae bacterium]|nr:hypothetical protein [Pyrinomonadaceae bacterium]